MRPRAADLRPAGRRWTEVRALCAAGLVATLLVCILLPYLPGRWTGRTPRGPLSKKLSDANQMGRKLELASALNNRQCPTYGPGQHPSFAFLHVPKTAGYMLVDTLTAVMPKEGRGRWCSREENGDLPSTFDTCSSGPPSEAHVELLTEVLSKFPNVCSGISMHQDSSFFSAAHVDSGRTITLTALRHPVDRVISDYYYSLRQNASWLLPYRPANATDFTGLQRFVEENRDGLNNLAATMLGDARHCDWPGTEPNLRIDAVLERAKRNLERFCVLLIQEYMEESMLRLASAAGWNGVELIQMSRELEARSTAAKGTRVNATPRPIVPLEVRQAIASANSLDMQLYYYAVQLFVGQGDS